MIKLRRNGNETRYFKHNNNLVKKDEIVAVHHVVHCDTIPSTVYVIQNKNVGYRIGPVPLDLNCFDYIGER